MRRNGKSDLTAEVARLRRQVARDRKAVARQRATDATLRKRNRQLASALAELQRTQSETIQKERLHALGQMASGIVHDFNNALTPILGASDFLVMNPNMLDNRVEALRLLGSIRTSAHDAKDMVMRLRDFYRPKDDVEVTAVDLNKVVQEVALLTRPKWREETAAKGTTIVVKTRLGRAPLLCCNDSQLREMLTNLVLNAVDAIDKKGKITVETKAEGREAVLRVSDTGKGMSEDIRQRCFEPFFSTKGKNGTGMGLAMVYGIVRKYRGRINVESEEGKGTVVEIRLPAGEGQVLCSCSIGTHASVTPPLKVLLYDTDPVGRRLFTEFLRSDGHKVESVNNAGTVLKKAKKGGYGLLVLDVIVSRGDGAQLARMVKKAVPSLPTILLSASVSFQKGDEERLEGVDVVLGKPATQAELRQAVASAVLSKKNPVC